MSKPQRNSRLAPFSLRGEIELAVEALNFFSPMHYETNCRVLERETTPGQTLPFQGADFLRYLDRTGKLDNARRYQARIGDLLNRLEHAGLLTMLGHGRDIFLGKFYYNLKELTTLERNSNLWLAKALGPRFIANQFADFTVQITGNSSGSAHAGTGLVIAGNWLLTCAHVISDMEVDRLQSVSGTEVCVEETLTHPDERVDIGLIRVEPPVATLPGLAFRDPEFCERVYTLGFPRVPLARTAPLVMQSGEITAPSVRLLQDAEVFLYSAIARPGNSGGPVVAADGHVVGIVTQELSAQGEQSPF